MPYFSASSLKLILDLRLSFRSLSVSITLRSFSGGLPDLPPRAFALRSPARTRSPIRLLSSSDTLASTVNIIFPVALLVSIFSDSETNSIPSARRVSSALGRWETDRANRSNFQTTTTSKRQRFASAISRFSSGRETDAPQIPLSPNSNDVPAPTLGSGTTSSDVALPEPSERETFGCL